MSVFPLTWAQLYLYPLIVTLALWGGLTLGLLWLNRLGVWASRIALALLLGMVLAAHYQLWAVRDDLSIDGVYRAFIAAILIWAWHELAFYSGVLAGPWRSACPPDSYGWTRLGYALATHFYHELAIGLEIVILAVVHHGASNVFGPLTFVMLWGLLHSAKINVLLGVRSLPLDWLPGHLRFLGTFWTPRRSNPFFLPSTLSITLIALMLWFWSASLPPYGFTVGVTLLAVLATLGALEHWLLALPPRLHMSMFNAQSSSRLRSNSIVRRSLSD